MLIKSDRIAAFTALYEQVGGREEWARFDNCVLSDGNCTSQKPITPAKIFQPNE